MCLTSCMVQGIEKSTRYSCNSYVAYKFSSYIIPGKYPLKMTTKCLVSLPALMCDLYSKLSRFACKSQTTTFFRLRIYNKDARWKLTGQSGRS